MEYRLDVGGGGADGALDDPPALAAGPGPLDLALAAGEEALGAGVGGAGGGEGGEGVGDDTIADAGDDALAGGAGGGDITSVGSPRWAGLVLFIRSATSGAAGRVGSGTFGTGTAAANFVELVGAPNRTETPADEVDGRGGAG